VTSARRTAAIASVMAAVVLGTSSCTTTDEPEPERHFALSPAPPSFTEGDDYTVKSRIPTVLDGQRVVYFDRVGGRLIMSLSGTSKSGQPSEDDPRGGALISVDPKTNDVTELARHGKPGSPRYIVDVAVAGKTVVWVETTQGNYDAMPWRLYALDLQTGEEKELASHRQLGIKDPPWPSPDAIRPQVVGDDVYVVAVDRVDDQQNVVQTSAYRVPLNGGRLEKVVPKATGAWAAGRNLDVLVDSTLARWDPDRGSPGEVTGAELPADCGAFAAKGVRVACTTADGRRLTVESTEHGRFTVNIGKNTVGYLNGTDDWVSFSTGDRAFLLDLRRGRLFSLPGSNDTGSRRLSGSSFIYVKQTSSPDAVRLVTLE
jgi:hypothetical protein